MAAGEPRYFSAGSFKFLRALARNNRRDWFQAHKEDYEALVKAPALRLIADLAQPLKRLSPQLVADPRPVGGSLFRIYRDTRFAKDKTPYKTHAGMTFFHAATRRAARGLAGTAALGRLDAPVLYLHLEPGECFMGGGIWHPQPPTLKRIRDFISDNPSSWQAATRSRSFSRHYALTGESLTRPPRGYNPAHKLIEDLKRTDFVASSALSDRELLRADLPRRLIERYRVLRPMLEWQCLALNLEF